MPKKQPGPSNGARGSSALEELRELYRFMQENGLEALELNRKDFHVRLVRQGKAQVPVPVPVPTQLAPSPAAPAQSTQAATGAERLTPLPPNAYVVKAPMMGIFYRAASPSSPPFAKEGDTVKPGDVICLIEAMKVFNDVKTEVGGVVARICLENGKPVKVGQELFIIERKC